MHPCAPLETSFNLVFTIMTPAPKGRGLFLLPLADRRGAAPILTPRGVNTSSQQGRRGHRAASRGAEGTEQPAGAQRAQSSQQGRRGKENNPAGLHRRGCLKFLV